MRLNIPEKRDRGRWYCGPHAYAVITGKSFVETRTDLNRIAGRRPNAGICSYTTWNMMLALTREGYNLKCDISRNPFSNANCKRFSAWLKEPRDKDAVYLVTLTGHFVTVKGDTFIDNHSKHLVNVAYAPWKNKLVREVWKITEKT